MLRRAPVSNDELARAAPFFSIVDRRARRRASSAYCRIGGKCGHSELSGWTPAGIGLLPTGEGHMAQQSHGIYITRDFLHESARAELG